MTEPPPFQTGVLELFGREIGEHPARMPVPLPVDWTSPPAPATPMRLHAEVLGLDGDGAWRTFSDRFTRGRDDNLKAWHRCLSVLRGAGARTVVIEQHYVCLDHKSEVASFYAHLDGPRPDSTVRLHFFASQLGVGDLLALDPHQSSYLGYVVCRESGLPLVGRCLLRVPEYITEHTAIEEPVNLFGQKLSVRGVPFMQQDQRFAVCAHAAAWVLAYTAYRRGTGERHLVGEVVSLGSAIRPLRPRSTQGLTEQDVAGILGDLGFRTETYHAPNMNRDYSTLPAIRRFEMASDTLNRLDAVLGGPDDGDDNLATRVADALWPAEGPPEADETDKTPTTVELGDALAAVHLFLDYVIRPYLRSGWPVYCGAGSHALVICGRSGPDDRPVHFVHDDQNGPYLAIECLPAASRRSLRWQSGGPDAEDLFGPDPDRVRRLVEGRTSPSPDDGDDADLAVDSLVFAIPARVLLQPLAATARAVALHEALRDPAQLGSGDEELVAGRVSMRVSILMGIDYKRARRQHSDDAGDQDAVAAFSALHLSEWVVVVEGADIGTGEALWELVFDASSHNAHPRLQAARILQTLIALYPKGHGNVETATIGIGRFPALDIPLRVAKTSHP